MEYAASRCGIRDTKIEGGVGALREPDVTNFMKPNGQSRNLNIYGHTVLTKSYEAQLEGHSQME